MPRRILNLAGPVFEGTSVVLQQALSNQPEPRRSTVQSVERALRLLSLFAPSAMQTEPHRSQRSVTELAKATGLHKSVVARLMTTMAGEGFVVQDPNTKTYSIGPQAFSVGNAYEAHRVLAQVARPIMEELTNRCSRSSYLGVPAGDRYIIVLRVEYPGSMQEVTTIGETRPYHANAIGKILLAGMSNERIRELLGTGPLLKLTSHTIDSVERLILEIEQVRRTGIAFIREETTQGIGAAAAGVCDRSGECVAGLSLLFPIVMPESEIQALGRVLAEAANTISNRLGAAVQNA